MRLSQDKRMQFPRLLCPQRKISPFRYCLPFVTASVLMRFPGWNLLNCSIRALSCSNSSRFAPTLSSRDPNHPADLFVIKDQLLASRCREPSDWRSREWQHHERNPCFSLLRAGSEQPLKCPHKHTNPGCGSASGCRAVARSPHGGRLHPRTARG